MTRPSREGTFNTGSNTKIDEQEQIRLVESPDPSLEMNHEFLTIDEKSLVIKNDLTTEMPHPPRRIKINRPVINLTMLSSGASTSQPSLRLNLLEWLRKKCSPLGCILSLFPILYWLPRYRWTKDITYDLTAGFTVAVMHIPQGMAYALLGNLPPIIGIYMAFFPVIIYSIMGTSRHVSMGTFAVICLMTGKVAAERVKQYNQITATNQTNSDGNNNMTTTSINETDVIYNEVDIAVALSLCVGLWQIVMGIFRMGALSLLLSSEVVSGFTTGAAVHVLTSQFKNLFGLKMIGRSGIFKILLTYMDIGTNIGIVIQNPTPLIMSVITISILVLYNEVLKPYVAKKTSFPIPMELFTIIVGTLVSSYWNMKANFNITIVEYIPTGLPTPALPALNILPDLLIDSLTISIVAYAISISMSKIFAIKYSYTLDANQELIAQGTSNIVGSFFKCAPIAASLSRSLVQELVGGKTQLAGLFSCGIILIVLLWIGPFFETLPNCILSSIIVVALKGMFLQIFDLPKALKLSILNGMIWILTFSVTVIMDIEYGLAIGILLSILILIWRSNKPQIDVLGAFYEFDGLYIESSNAQSKEIPGRKIIKYTGNLNFATIEHFIKKIQRIVPYNINQIDVNQKDKSHEIASTSDKMASTSKIEQDKLRQFDMNFEEEMTTEWIILDFSSLSSIDPEALKSLLHHCKRYEKIGIQHLFAACPSTVIKMMNTCKFINQIGIINFFPSVHDAVSHCSSSQIMQSEIHT